MTLRGLRCRWRALRFQGVWSTRGGSLQPGPLPLGRGFADAFLERTTHEGSAIALQGGCCGSGAKTIDDAGLPPTKPAPPPSAQTHQPASADKQRDAAVTDSKPAVPNSQQTDGLPESVPVVLPPPDKADAVAGIPLQPAAYQDAVGQQAQLLNGSAAAGAPAPFFSPFADNRKARTASMDAQRNGGGGSNGSATSVSRFAGNGTAAAGGGGGFADSAGLGAPNGSAGSPMNSVGSRQSSLGAGLKSRSFVTSGSGALADQPATCVWPHLLLILPVLWARKDELAARSSQQQSNQPELLILYAVGSARMRNKQCDCLQ